MKPRLHRRFVPAASVLAISSLLVVLSSNGTTASYDPGNPQFAPTIDYKLCNDLPPSFNGPDPLPGAGGACVEDPAQGANPDLTFDLHVPAGHVMFASRSEILTLSNEFDVAGDEDVPDGTVVGGTHNVLTLGLFIAPCNNTAYPDFILYDATADIENLLIVEGDPNAILYFNGGDPFDGQADSTSPVVHRYPDFNNRLFDPDSSGDSSGGFSPVQPHARYAGMTNVGVSGEWELLQVFIFEPGALKAAFSANPQSTTHPFARLDASLGWTAVIVVDNPVVVESTVTPISDVCSPLTVVGMLLGRVDTNGDTIVDTDRLTSPAAVGGIDGEGTQLAQMYALSTRDADSDGLQNPFDTCAFEANVDNPYVSSGADTDMLDPACDPAPTTKDDDQDDDGFLNNQDICPIVYNPAQTESENATPFNLAAPDGGPRADLIGDACDSEQGGNDTVANGLFFHAFASDAFCINDNPYADEDGDGWCSVTAGADPNDSDPNVTGENNQDADAHLFPGQPGHSHRNYREIYMQTDPLADCPEVTGKHDAWPPDFDMSRVINITDVYHVLPPVYGSHCGQPNYRARSDFDANCIINVNDVFNVLPPIFGSSCTPP